MEDKLIVTVELSSGKFHSRIQVPLFASDESKKAFVETWLQLIETGLKAGRSSREQKTFTNVERLKEAFEETGLSTILRQLTKDPDTLAAGIVDYLTARGRSLEPDQDSRG